MSEVFNIRRFWRYFLHDLKSAKDGYLVSLLVCCLTPQIAYFFGQILSLITRGQFMDMPSSVRMAIVLCAVAVVELTFPVKVYGGLTEKKTGSNWILLPASVLEKFVSMLLIICIVLPLTFCVLLSGFDLLSSVILPHYGDALVTSCRPLSELVEEFEDGNVNLFGLTFVGWVSNIMIFTLGAVFFKKGKVAKTIFSVFLVGMALGTIIVPALALCFHGFDFDLAIELDSVNVEFWVNFVLNALITVLLLSIGTGLFFRLKTMKH